MMHRMLLKAALVTAMGVAALATPNAEGRAQGPCYTCYDSGGECPDEATFRAICEEIGGTMCPEPDECVWGTGECPSANLVRLTCKSALSG